MGLSSILIPLVDRGRIENKLHEKELLKVCTDISSLLEEKGMMISFESDFSALDLNIFISQFNPRYFGITYDIGNSASLGYNPQEEIIAYGNRIINVHVKDRILGGTTVPMGSGNADIPLVLKCLEEHGYTGNYILQTARAENGDHIGTLCKYRDLITECFQEVKNRNI